MANTILFSPIGGSDPISNQRDGSMLHICRNFKPDRVYLYLSHSMLERENKDQRYTKVLELLGEKLGHTFDAYKIERPELVDVADYDNYYDDFEKIIKDIAKDSDTLLINTSSGTPAMKSALYILEAMTDFGVETKLIQVSSGETVPVEGRDRSDDFVLDEQWACDLDNELSENRCKTVQTKNLVSRIKKEIITSHINSYDYGAALEIARSMHTSIGKEALKYIRAAKCRIELDGEGVRKTGADNIFPVTENGKNKTAEALFALDIRLRRREYSEFIKLVTPVSLNLLKGVLEKYCGIGDITSYCEYDKRYCAYKLTRKKLNETETGKRMLEILDKKYKSSGFFKDDIYNSSHLCELIKNMSSDNAITKKIEIIRKAECKIRNLAAHTLTTITAEMIYNGIGTTPQGLFGIIKSVAEDIGITKDSDWTTYDDMNKKIIELIKSESPENQ